MKIGILTFHRALNYGAILQSYALQQVLEQAGFDACILDYRCAFIEKLYRPFDIRYSGSPSEWVKKTIKSPQLWKKRNAFAQFTGDHLRLSPKCGESSLPGAAQDYNLLITGSDQVFNPHTTGGDLAYFLPFSVPGRKIAYAASLGYDGFPPEYRQRCVEALEDFDAISVREISGVQPVAEAWGRPVEWAVDPVLLLPPEQWSALWKKPRNVPEKYVLAYMMEGSRYTVNRARALAKEKNCALVCVNPTLKQQIHCRDFRLLTAASVEEFVWLMAHAEAVVTNSFHGTAFSLVFRRAFYAEISNEKRGTRIRDLLEQTGLTHRLLPGCGGSICWDAVEEQLENMREHSRAWLMKAIHNSGC